MSLRYQYAVYAMCQYQEKPLGFELLDLIDARDKVGTFKQYATAAGSSLLPFRKRLRIRSVISVNYHYITVLCPFNLLIRFKCYNTV